MFKINIIYLFIYIISFIKIEFFIKINNKHWWFSGRMLACHAGGPGSIPGQCSLFLFFFKLHLSFIWSRRHVKMA